MYSVQYDSIEDHSRCRDRRKQRATLMRTIIFVSVVCIVSFALLSGLCEYLEYSIYRQNVEVINLESYLTMKIDGMNKNSTTEQKLIIKEVCLK